MHSNRTLSIVRTAMSSRMLSISSTCATSGGGKGTGIGGGGAVREAGGKFAEMEVAREEEYFRKLQAAQLKNLKQELDREISHHEHEIARHAAAIERHKKRVQEIEKEQSNSQKQ